MAVAHLLLLPSVAAPALDWVDADLHNQYKRAYLLAVSTMQGLSHCRPSPHRYAAKQHRSLDPFGNPLVPPLHERRVPVAQNKVMHLHHASALPWPGNNAFDRALPMDITCAADEAVALGSALARTRTARANAWTRACDSLRPYSDAIIQRHAPSHTLPINAHVNVACIAAATDALDYRDKSLPRLLVLGFPMTGCPIADSRVYRPIASSPGDIAACEQQRARMQDHAASSRWATLLAARTTVKAQRDPAQAAAIHKTTAKEVTKGRVFGPFHTTTKLRRHLHRLTGQDAPLWPMPRFARLQSSGWRCIDDARASGTNTAAIMHETIVCPSFDFPIQVARYLATAHPHLRLNLRVALSDLSGAYRYIPNTRPQHAVFPVYHAGSIGWYYMPGQPFGVVAAVVNFNRFSELIATVVRCLFAAPTEKYFDDFIQPDLATGGDTASDSLEAVVAAFGDGHDTSSPYPPRPRRASHLDAAKHKPASRVNTILGVEVDLHSLPHSHTIHFRCTAQRRSAILQLWDASRDALSMSKSDAATIHGKTGFALTAAFGRVGRAATLPLVNRQHRDKSTAWTPALEHAYEFFKALLSDRPDGTPLLPDLVLSARPETRPPVTVYTDAAYRRKRREPGECSSNPHDSRLGFVIHDPTAWDPHRRRYGLTLYSDQLPSLAVMSTFSPDMKTYISQLEALAALTVYASADKLRQAGIDLHARTVTHFIDNSASLSALIHGYSSSVDLARISNQFHLTCAAKRIRPWLEFVPSLANIADSPSRGDFSDLERIGARRVDIPSIGASDWMKPLKEWMRDALD